MKKLITKIALWLLNKCHYQIPVIVENIIRIDDCQHLINQKVIPPVMDTMFTPQEFHKRVVEDVKREALQRLMSEVKTTERQTPDGTLIRLELLWVQPKTVVNDVTY